MEDTNTQTLNPWYSMWIRPRATIQQIVDHDPRRFVLLLAFNWGFIIYLESASAQDMGSIYPWQAIVVFAVICGIMTVFIGLRIYTALIRWTGKWLGGQASVVNVRAALGWSSVPHVWGLILWIGGISLFGQELFTIKTPVIDTNLTMLSAFAGFGLLLAAYSIWSWVTLLKCVGQVQGFSAWRALVNLVLASIALVAPIEAVIFITYKLS